MDWYKKAKKSVSDNYGILKSSINDESKAHQAVSVFLVKTNELLAEQKADMTEVSIAAAEGLIREIKALMEVDSNLQAPHWPIFQRDLLDNTLDVIYKYQTQLEASPGFWNQLKASINTLIEQVSGVKNVFSVEKTVHGADINFQAAKDGISDLIDDIDGGSFKPR